jgi:hypothetical protein
MVDNADNNILTRSVPSGDAPQFLWNQKADAGFTMVMIAPTMTNERKIWEAALLLYRRHGAQAVAIAEGEAARLRGGDDDLTCIVWCWIARSTAELLRPQPGADERSH